MPETYLVLTERWDGGGSFPDVVGQKIAISTSLLLPPGADEDALNDFQRAYIGDHATRLVIRAAVDYYSVRTGLSDDMEPVSSSHYLSQRGPGTGRRNYDRVRNLWDLDAKLEASLSAQKEAFYAGLPGATSTAGIMIDSTPEDLVTLDPSVMASIGKASRLPRYPPWSWPDWANQDATVWPP